MFFTNILSLLIDYHDEGPSGPDHPSPPCAATLEEARFVVPGGHLKLTTGELAAPARTTDAATGKLATMKHGLDSLYNAREADQHEGAALRVFSLGVGPHRLAHAPLAGCGKLFAPCVFQNHLELHRRIARLQFANGRVRLHAPCQQVE